MPFTTGDHGLLQLNQADFDFNIQFEQLFFSIIPSALFIASSILRGAVQWRKPTVCAISTYALLTLPLLILSSLNPLHASSPLSRSLTLSSSSLELLSACTMLLLSSLDHRKTPRPSTLLTGYLFLTLLLDAARARTLFLSSSDHLEISYSAVFCAAIGVKLLVLVLEAQQKGRWVKWKEEGKRERSPEETSGIFELGVFGWLNRLFLRGYRKTLAMRDLYPLDGALEARGLHEGFAERVDYGALKGDRFGLVKVLVRTLRVPLLMPVAPRLALLGFTFCQPFFIQSLVDHLAQSQVPADDGYGLIGASVLIYSGIAVSTALYWYFHFRMRAMVRSILVTEVFNKATKSRIGAGDDSAAVTLMSTDMERISMGLRSLHEMWASLIQVVIAAWLLYDQLGVAFIAPMIVVGVCSVGLTVLIKYTGDSQRAWMNGVQKRVGLTATVIASMKNLKMSGLASAISDFVQQLRVDELRTGSRFRKIGLYAAILGYMPLLLSPPLAFAFAQKRLDSARIFTSLSYLLLLTNPLSQIFQSVPEFLSTFACLGRIQTFLECEDRDDFRKVLTDLRRTSEKAPAVTLSPSGLEPDSDVAIVVRNGSFGWQSDRFALQDINMRFSKASLTLVIGPVGSGKSTLCKALLGEIPFSEGHVELSTRFPHVGFCDQTTFLSNGTIRDNIVGFSTFDPERYAEVVEATALDFDFNTLEKGDASNVGSDGITLSGGQKQRVALARGLYLQSELLVLDDIFSGLDADTEEQVFRRVFGPRGVLRHRRATVVLCTHSVRHLPAADHIVALGNGTIMEQGTFGALMAGQGYVQRLGLTMPSEEDKISVGDIETSPREDKAQHPKAILTNTSPDDSDLAGSKPLRDKTVYTHYMRSIGFTIAFTGSLFSALWGFFVNFPTIWLTYWSDSVSSMHPTHSDAYYASIYAVLQAGAMVSLVVVGVSIFIQSVKKAGANLHHEALRTLIRAPLGFFTTTDTGVVTNLFSQDLNLTDTELPNAVLNVLTCTAQLVGQAAVMLTSSPYMAASYPFLLALLYVVQKFYLRTSKQMRILDLEAKSPLYTHFLDTLKGIVTLRAFGFIPEDAQKNVRLINTSQRPAYLLVMVQQWLNFVLDVVVMLIAAILTTLAVRLHSNSGFTGASLVTLMTFGESLSGIVIYYTKLETSIGAIARLKAFNENVKPEDTEEEDLTPPEHWPQQGTIELKNVSASYDPSSSVSNPSKLALNSLNLSIPAGEKLAICGRTGSGKSSLIALLLKLLDPLPTSSPTPPGPQPASISGFGPSQMRLEIDSLPLPRIHRPSLRDRILAVPQEAVFLPDGCSFHANLDPSGAATVQECEEVLAAIGMRSFVEGRGGVEAGMSASTLSAGQRQLMSLGRVLVRRRVRGRALADENREKGCGEGGVLLLDEVSSNVDYETERVMQGIIREEFGAYTVIAVSHRLEMIMDFDRVVVMDTGEIVEVGNPRALAAEEGTRFGELITAGGR